ncbi:MAG: hypothetical protein HC851_15165 [Acaryochloris sp. RU_4_1]|nr:hypothetical protein [Acaryochloris sp. RU_4_1]
MKQPYTKYSFLEGIFMLVLGGLAGAAVVLLIGDQFDLPKKKIMVGSALFFGACHYVAYRFTNESKQERLESLESSLKILRERQERESE